MGTKAGLKAMLLAAGLLFSTAVVARAQSTAAINVNPTAWNSGVTGSNGLLTSVFLAPASNPVTLFTPSEVVFGNTLTFSDTLATGTKTETFSNIPVDVDFDMTVNGVTNEFVASGVVNGTMTFNQTLNAGNSQTYVYFTELQDTTTGATVFAPTLPSTIDPYDTQADLGLTTALGGVYIDWKQQISWNSTPTSVTGYITPVPELGSCTAMLSMLTGSGVLGLAIRRRNRK